jgi:hypothetical protein
VNDPERPSGRIAGPEAGSFHVLGSGSALIGIAVRGGRERRPICRAARSRNFLQAQALVARTGAEDERDNESIVDARAG